MADNSIKIDNSTNVVSTSEPGAPISINVSTINLPRELWLEIMSYMDYFDLKRCMGVSTLFKTFTETATFDNVLFRSQAIIPTDGTINVANTRLHHAFELVSFECATSIDQAYFFTNNYDDTIPLTESAAAKEQATSPPVSVLRLQVHSFPVMQVKNKKGVTVLQVMKALCRFFAKGDYRECMGDHTGWTGWDSKRLDGRGRLVLKAQRFDS
jgi:hypothetical protein